MQHSELQEKNQAVFKAARGSELVLHRIPGKKPKSRALPQHQCSFPPCCADPGYCAQGKESLGWATAWLEHPSLEPDPEMGIFPALSDGPAVIPPHLRPCVSGRAMALLTACKRWSSAGVTHGMAPRWAGEACGHLAASVHGCGPAHSEGQGTKSCGEPAHDSSSPFYCFCSVAQWETHFMALFIIKDL